MRAAQWFFSFLSVRTLCDPIDLNWWHAAMHAMGTPYGRWRMPGNGPTDATYAICACLDHSSADVTFSRGMFLFLLCVIIHTCVASAHMRARASVGVALVAGLRGWIRSITCASVVSRRCSVSWCGLCCECFCAAGRVFWCLLTVILGSNVQARPSLVLGVGSCRVVPMVELCYGSEGIVVVCI